MTISAAHATPVFATIITELPRLSRHELGVCIDAMIAWLDFLDGDVDREAEEDFGADDAGEECQPA